jgi:hypothetical protein
MAPSTRTPWSVLVSYVLPAFSLAALGMPIVVHLPKFYASRVVGIGCSVAIAFGTLAWLGFDPKIHNKAAAIEHLRVFNIALPLVLAAISLVTMLGYPLDEAAQKRLRADIDARRAAAIPATPDTAITGEALAEGPAE